MKKNLKSLIPLLIPLAVFLIIILPIVSFAQPATSSSSGLVPPCGIDPVTGQCVWGVTEFIKLINNVIDFVFKFLAIPIAAIMFFYAGITLITAGGGEGKTKAKNIFLNAVIGLALAAGAWLIIKTLLLILGYKDIGLFF